MEKLAQKVWRTEGCMLAFWLKCTYNSCDSDAIKDLLDLCVCIPPAFMYYYDNPKGMLPTWLINWAAKVLLMLLYIIIFVPRYMY